MPVRPAVCAAVAVALLSLAAGCGPPKLNVKQTFSLEAGIPKGIDLPAVNKPQRITVEFTSSAAEVSVYIIKNFKGEEGLGDQPPTKAQTLEMQRGKSGTVSADVSPDTETRVVVRDARQKTEVSLTVTNRR
jgi:hypothetical protein